MDDPEAKAIARWNAAGQDTRRLDWYLRRSRASNMTYIKTGSESDYLSGMRKWIDECLNAGEV
jgi:hypothetical protein